MICWSALVVTDDMARPLTGAVKARFPCTYLLRGQCSLGMGSCSTISILLHRLTDLLTLSLGLSVGGRDQ